MSYIPTNWKAGDTVTSAKLNKIEQGVASSGSVFMINLQEDGSGHLTSLVTYEDIEEACKDKMPIARIIDGPEEGYFGATYMQVMVVNANPGTSEYGFTVSAPMGTIQFVTDDPSGYPTLPK